MKKLLIFILCFTIGWIVYTRLYPPIPKIIHYVWLGKSDLPAEVRETLASWKKYAPNFQIIRWDETNCDINANEFIRDAYQKKLWAWASDYCRLKALYQMGGVYMDTDQLLHSPIEDVLAQTQLVMTYQVKEELSASFIAAIPRHPFIKELIHLYDTMAFNIAPMPQHLTNKAKEYFQFEPNGLLYKSTALTLYPTNVLMLDFGGGENISTHRYDSSSTSHLKGQYFKITYQLFLQEMGIPVCFDTEQDFIIPTENQSGYIYSTKEKVKQIHKKDGILTYTRNGKKETFRWRRPCYIPVFK
ncbi:MAG: glycosyltransferase family 32 protein [Alphaproteobacteria bacterium]